MADRILRVDMGDRFPLKHTVYPLRGHAPYALLATVLLLVVPVAYFLDTGRRPEWWVFFVLMVGVASAVGTIAALWMRVTFGVNAKAVAVELRTLFRRQSSVEPLTDYVALVTTQLYEAAFVGARGAPHRAVASQRSGEAGAAVGGPRRSEVQRAPPAIRSAVRAAGEPSRHRRPRVSAVSA